MAMNHQDLPESALKFSHNFNQPTCIMLAQNAVQMPGNAISNATSKNDTKSGKFFSPGSAPNYATKTKAFRRTSSIGSKKETNYAPLPASDETKAQALHLVNGFIEQEVKKVTDLNKIVLHHELLKAAREASHSKFGVIISTRQIEKYRAKLRIYVHAIVDLEGLLQEIDQSDFVENFADKAAAIVKRNHSLEDLSTLSALNFYQDSGTPEQEPKQGLMQDPSAVALETPLDTRDPKPELRDFIQQGTSAALAPPIPLKMRVGARTA
jgi:hypothetical protein